MSVKTDHPEMSSLFADFARYFELSLALTEEQKKSVFRVRYNVYCEGFGYENPNSFADRMERDVFDAQSLHCLVTHKASGIPAGCVRFVMPEQGSHMPMEDHCRNSLDSDFLGEFANLRNAAGEISRLAVDGQFRRRRGEKGSRFGNTATLHFAAREKRTFSLIAVALFLSAASLADLRRRQHCFAIMEPFLPVILRRTGIVVKRVGADFDYRGVRAPYYLNIDEAKRTIPAELRLCFDAVKARFADVLQPPGERHGPHVAVPHDGGGASDPAAPSMRPFISFAE